MPKVKDYYELLGVSRQASRKDIQSAFRKLARSLHPDLHPGDREAERRFKEVSEAHSVLADPEKRKLYDRFGESWQQAAAAGATGDGPFAGGAGPFAGGARYETRTIDPEEFERMFTGEGGFGDLFGGIFGRGRSARGAGTAGAATPFDVEGDVEVSLQEAYRGTSRQVTMPDGRRLEVKVPPGVQDGTVLRVPGLRARVRVAADPLFAREGRNLRVAVAVPLKTALLGGEVDVPTLKGGRVKLTVPAATQNGTRLRLRGLGMPGPSGGAAGDLFAEVRVVLPLPVDDRTRSWAEQLPD